ncbi:hypothetical protein [Maridesulfovibrio frigidus]|uniref:hypothetical protein n=1 Tax=Maridesulfovibrio frigidus TaxID=340956 RepID=UPI0004E10DA7|nr:hypothetical protein [Maridesulfovibrio frigidus]
MFSQKEYIFKGFSGTDYPFEIMKKSSDFEPATAIYIFTYKHLRGHMAGFAVNPLHIGQTDNLKKALIDHPQKDCLFNECSNCIHVMKLDADESARKAIVEDLLKANPTPC